ncbi:MAG TPA: hypothetical protein VH475_08535 [Tepidisphaeraceae bacterium]|jgi:hypothetical protein
MPRFVFLLSAFCLLPAACCFSAELSLTFPLGPYYRPGKYLPVHITADISEPGEHWLALAPDNVWAADDVPRGAGRTGVYVAQPGRVDAIVPWFVNNDRGATPRLFIEYRPEHVEGPTLRRLAESERLVGWTVPDEPFARQLLGAPPKVIGVALDPAQPIKGHACAWEMLDAIILDANSATRLDQEQIADLLACGVTVAVKTDHPPFAAAWPWRRVGEYSVLRFDPAGPDASGFVEQAYAPVAGWQAGWPWAFRRQVLLIAALCCVPLLGLALWRPPLTPLWGVLLSAILIFGVGKWWGVHTGVQQAAGEVIVIDHKSGLTQTDDWTYQTCTANRTGTLRWIGGVTRPIANDDLFVTLNCDTTGRPAEFLADIPPNRKLAFVSRTVGPRAPRTTPARPITSPLAPLVNELYLNDHAQVLGQLPTAPPSQPAYGYVELQQWNAVVVGR